MLRDVTVERGLAEGRSVGTHDAHEVDADALAAAWTEGAAGAGSTAASAAGDPIVTGRVASR